MHDFIARADVSERNASNLTEFWHTDAHEGILHLYALTLGHGAPLYSDFDRFRALCEMMPLMNGHTELTRCCVILQTEFHLAMRPSVECCDEIWRVTAEELLRNPRKRFSKALHALPAIGRLPADLPRLSMPPCVDTGLLKAPFDGLTEWQSAIGAWLDAHTSNAVCVSLDDRFSFTAPDPYHVGLALRAPRRTEAEQDLLTAQLLRILCVLLQKKEGHLHLQVGACGRSAIELLGYLEKTVGMPYTTWQTSDDYARDLLLRASLGERTAALLPTVRGEDLQPDPTGYSVLSALAARFPVGLLQEIEA